MRKIFILLNLLFLLFYGKEFLVVIEIDKPIIYDQLNKIKEFVPVALLNKSVIGKIEDKSLSDLINFNYQILCETKLNRNEAFYLLYYPKEKEDLDLIKKNLENYCEVLYNEGQTFLVKVDLRKLDYLREFELCYLSLRPIILPKSDEIIWESKKPEILNISQPNPIIQKIIDRITPSELAELIRQLSGEKKCFVLGDSDSIFTRYAPTQQNSKAIWWFYENLLSFNLDSVLFDSFGNYPTDDSNVIGVKLGRVYPNYKYFLLGGHIDAVSVESSWIYAPGADDNASGVLTALIAAKYLKDIPFKYTIKFIAWNAEEQGVIGSWEHALKVAQQGDSIMGVINCDMIASETSNLDSIIIYTGLRRTSQAIGETMYVVNQRYNIGLNIRISDSIRVSDHMSYYGCGYNAVWVHEKDFCPDYHTTRDRIIRPWFDTLFYCKVVKLVVATLATLAIPDTSLGLVENRIVNKIDNKSLNKELKGEIYNIFGQKINRENIKKGIYYLKEDIDFRKIILLK